MTKWPTARARPPRIPGGMNKTEERYRQELQMRKKIGEILEFWFEGVKLRLAENTTYTPDFMVLLPSGELELHECKGYKMKPSGADGYYVREDANVKIKVAAQMYPFRFVIAYERPQSKGGGWSSEEF